MATEGKNRYLPDEIFVSILERLPVKSLIRFQSVSKHWKNLSKTPSFIAYHVHHSRDNNPFLILKRSSGDIYFLSDKMEILEVHKPPPLVGARIVGSSDGLLCVQVGYSNGLLCVLVGSRRHALLLCNPATREVRYIPKTYVSRDQIYQIYQIFVFGFSPIVNDYKILRLSCDDLMTVHGVEVYSLGIGSWKEVEFGILRNVTLRHETDDIDSVTANGTMFWLGKKDDLISVISFDIAMEVFKVIPMPGFTSTHESHHNRLIVYEGKLAMFHYCYMDENVGPSFIDLWVMEEGNGASGKTWSWTKKYAIRSIPRTVHPICIWTNEIVCNFVAKSRIGKKVVEHGNFLCLLNLTTNKLRNVIYPYDPCGGLNSAGSLMSISTSKSNSIALMLLGLHCTLALCQNFL